MYDTDFGNGKKLAEFLKDEFPNQWDVQCGDVKDIKPEKVIEDKPDFLILGGAIRKFQGAPKSKKWLADLNSKLENSKQKIEFSMVFLTHALPRKNINGWVKRYLKKLQQASSINKKYPDCLTARVKSAEGPIIPEEFEKAKSFVKDINNWMNV